MGMRMLRMKAKSKFRLSHFCLSHPQFQTMYFTARFLSMNETIPINCFGLMIKSRVHKNGKVLGIHLRVIIREGQSMPRD